MRPSKSEQLRKVWEAKGNPPCDHPSVDRELRGGYDTGNKVCLVCGTVIT